MAACAAHTTASKTTTQEPDERVQWGHSRVVRFFEESRRLMQLPLGSLGHGQRTGRDVKGGVRSSSIAVSTTTYVPRPVSAVRYSKQHSVCRHDLTNCTLLL